MNCKISWIRLLELEGLQIAASCQPGQTWRLPRCSVNGRNCWTATQPCRSGIWTRWSSCRQKRAVKWYILLGIIEQRINGVVVGVGALSLREVVVPVSFARTKFDLSMEDFVEPVWVVGRQVVGTMLVDMLAVGPGIVSVGLVVVVEGASWCVQSVVVVIFVVGAQIAQLFECGLVVEVEAAVFG